MLTNSIIRLVMLGRPLFKKLGVQTTHLQTILQTKCTVDDRTPKGLNVYGGGRQSKSASGMYFLMGIFGIFMAFILFLFDNPFLAYAIFFGTFIAYLTMNLITGFSDVLVDVRDHYLIMCRPVNDRTIAAARLLHIFIHIAKMVLPLGLPALLLVAFKNGGIALATFALALTSATIISVFAVNIIYLLLLQIMSPRKFRDVIAYFQIAFTTLLFAGYYIFPKFIKYLDLNKITPTDYLVSYFLPPVWLAGLQRIGEGVLNPSNYLFFALSVIFPVLCLVIIVRFLSRNYSNNLSLLGAASENARTESTNSVKRKSFTDTLTGWIPLTPLEQVGYQITWKLTSRMREFKTRVYPSFGFIPIIFANFFLVGNSRQSVSEQWHNLSHTSYYLVLLYSLSYISVVILEKISQSKKYRAAWFYSLTPSRQPGQILSGMLKALLTKYHLPASVICVVFILYVWGISSIPQIILGLLAMLFVSIVLALLRVKEFPMSTPVDMQEKTANVFFAFLYMILIGALGFAHYMIRDYPLLIGVISVLLGGINWLLFQKYKHLQWADLE